MASVDERLAEFRAKKAAESRRQQRRDWLWDWATMGPLRRRAVTQTSPPASLVKETSDSEMLEEPRTAIEYAILAVKTGIWLCLWLLCIQLEVGAVFFVSSGFVFIWKNLGKRSNNQPSAYSVFNPNFEAIEGTLTAEQFEREIRHRPAQS